MPESSALPSTIPVLLWTLLLPYPIPCDSDNLLSPPPPRILNRPLPTRRRWETPFLSVGNWRERNRLCCLAGHTPSHRTAGTDLCLRETCTSPHTLCLPRVAVALPGDPI